MKIKFLITLLFLVFATTSPLLAENAAPAFEEGISFEIKTIPLEHQGPNVVDLKVRFDYKPELKDKEYPDFQPLYLMGPKFLAEYPDKADYWEVVIKKLTAAYLAKEPNIDSVTIDLLVYPTKTVPYFHTVHCTALRSE